MPHTLACTWSKFDRVSSLTSSMSSMASTDTTKKYLPPVRSNTCRTRTSQMAVNVRGFDVTCGRHNAQAAMATCQLLASKLDSICSK